MSDRPRRRCAERRRDEAADEMINTDTRVIEGPSSRPLAAASAIASSSLATEWGQGQDGG